MGNLLDCGRILYTDNFYTSIPLAKTLLSHQTHLVGTLRKNRRGLPREVISRKLKKGQVVAQQRSDGILVLKWRDKRDVLMLSTMHKADFSDGKPRVISDYNAGKTFIDISDQMAAYGPFVRKTNRWYLRIFFHAVCQIAVVNAWNLYKMHTGKSIKIINFRRQIVSSILKPASDPSTSVRSKHFDRARKNRTQTKASM
ncbi:unnamed protein product [Cylicostephanus goldi]|uniref:PiggyBac transposable element-derived protein domain-containing protein n=1 Tax=Cylicostephanus goldi TaxID=71465 RepID=A0A3P6SFF4_CYLGO|nr:unnamed protein product [Cylicostephanus goldi]